MSSLFHRDLDKDLEADYILANPPFNMSDWGGDRLREDARWKFKFGANERTPIIATPPATSHQVGRVLRQQQTS